MDYSRRPVSARKVSLKPCKRARGCPGHTGGHEGAELLVFPDSRKSRELLPDRKQLQLRRHSSDYVFRLRWLAFRFCGDRRRSALSRVSSFQTLPLVVN